MCLLIKIVINFDIFICLLGFVMVYIAVSDANFRLCIFYYCRRLGMLSMLCYDLVGFSLSFRGREVLA